MAGFVTAMDGDEKDMDMWTETMAEPQLIDRAQDGSFYSDGSMGEVFYES
jgi:hypothetical protein